jgi:hypothetical protein
MTNGVFYEAETIDITLTLQADTVYLKATTPGTETMTVYGMEGDDQFYLGGADALFNLHGSLALWGGNDSDRMWITNQTCTHDFDTGDAFDSVLGLGTFTGQGLNGTLTFSGFEDLGISSAAGRTALRLILSRSASRCRSIWAPATTG